MTTEQITPTKTPELDRFYAYIVKKCSDAKLAQDLAKTEFDRCQQHVKDVENDIDETLPAQIAAIEDALDSAIAAGRGLDTLRKKLLDKSNELLTLQAWHNNKSDALVKDAAEKYRLATSDLKAAAMAAFTSKHVLGKMLERFEEGVRIMSEADEDFYFLQRRMAPDYPPLDDAFLLLNGSGAVADFYRDQPRVARFKKRLDVLTDDFVRAGYVFEARNKAERQAKQQAADKIELGNKKRSMSMKRHLAGEAGELITVYVGLDRLAELYPDHEELKVDGDPNRVIQIEVTPAEYEAMAKPVEGSVV